MIVCLRVVIIPKPKGRVFYSPAGELQRSYFEKSKFHLTRFRHQHFIKGFYINAKAQVTFLYFQNQKIKAPNVIPVSK